MRAGGEAGFTFEATGIGGVFAVRNEVNRAEGARWKRKPNWGATWRQTYVQVGRLEISRKREAKKADAEGQQIERATERHNGVGLTVGVTALRSGPSTLQP